MKFRKKPIIVEATQFWNDKPFPKGVCDCGAVESYGTPHIHTLEGVMDVSESNWVVTGIEGEKYPVKNSIFKATYDEI